MESLSDQKRKLAREQNAILMEIMSHMSDDKFDLDTIDFSKFESRTLRDFWVYATGFLCLHNYENYVFSDAELNDINRGKFILKELSESEVQEYCKSFGKKYPKNGLAFGDSIILDYVQDAKFSLKGKIGGTVLRLQTAEPELVSDTTEEIDGDFALKVVRNVYAHGAPFIDGATLRFLTKNEELAVSKMWLRGFAETFVKHHASFDTKGARETLLVALGKTGNYIESEKQIDEALSAIKGYVSIGVLKNYHRVTQLVKNRIKMYDDFFQKSFEEKVDIVVALVARNQIYFENGFGEISPELIYNLQQLVSQELTKRDEFALVSDDEADVTIAKLADYNRRFDELTEKMNRLKEKYPDPKKWGNSYYVLAKAAVKECDRLQREYDAYQQKVSAKLKLESSFMEHYSTQELEKLPIELAFSVVGLMAFNSLVTSGFYEEMLAKTDFNANMTPEQVKFFDRIDMSGFSLNGKPYVKSPTSNAFMLLCMREALCHRDDVGGHNGVFYKLVSKKSKSPEHFGDIEMSFVASRQNVVFSGKLIDFYKLFSSKEFTCDRALVRTATVGANYFRRSNGTLSSNEIYGGSFDYSKFDKKSKKKPDETSSGDGEDESGR